jgi:hypothetical protein
MDQESQCNALNFQTTRGKEDTGIGNAFLNRIPIAQELRTRIVSN